VTEPLGTDQLCDPSGGVRWRYPWRAYIWLVFVLIPLGKALNSHDSGVAKAAVIAATSVFVGIFVWLIWRQPRPLPLRRAVLIIIVLLAIPTCLVLTDGAAWATLFIYVGGVIANNLPGRWALVGVGVCAGLSAGSLLIIGSSAGVIIGYATPALGVGMLMLVMADLRASNRQLVDARAELAQLAVTRERERFARDLHDLLGHTLSVIALKAELAGRLVEHRPEEAAREITEVQGVARQALAEVREAVSGYRQPTLTGELEGARMALSAAGVQTEISRAEVTLAPVVEGVLAWTVREGATNVIRHSCARTCLLRVSAELSGAVAEVIDDGVGASASDGAAGRFGRGGHGLEGLAERARALGGSLESGPQPGGGFRLAVRVPLDGGSATPVSEPASPSTQPVRVGP
jgi:two-component system, NarL family, sensor histidine kinase DesK